jgi:hypothetical protein
MPHGAPHCLAPSRGWGAPRPAGNLCGAISGGFPLRSYAQITCNFGPTSVLFLGHEKDYSPSSRTKITSNTLNFTFPGAKMIDWRLRPPMTEQQKKDQRVRELIAELRLYHHYEAAKALEQFYREDVARRLGSADESET